MAKIKLFIKYHKLKEKYTEATNCKYPTSCGYSYQKPTTMHQKILRYFFALSFIFLSSCGPCDDCDGINFPKGEVEGLKPIYGSLEEVKAIHIESARDLENPGKIYVKGQYLYINERSKGIHIIDNSDPSAPINVSFIDIPGNIDIAAKGNIFYVDNYKDLVAIEIINPQTINIVKRIEGAVPYNGEAPSEGGYFECVDASKGIVIGWEQATLISPECYRQ